MSSRLAIELQLGDDVRASASRITSASSRTPSFDGG
jgi:hypothetical protein